MVLGRRELSAILLAIAAILVYLVLLSTTPSGAQTGGGTTDQQDSCTSSEQLVQTFNGTQDETTPAFQISGAEWRFIVQATSTSPATGTVSVDVQKADGSFSPGSALALVDPQLGRNTASASSNVIDGPGSFNLVVDENGASYTILVCQAGGQGQTTTNPINPSNQGGVTAIANPPRKPQRERTVVNVPNKPLPPSGGLPVYAIVVSCILTGTGLLALGLVIRCGSRR